MAESVNPQHQHQKQQDSAGIFSNSVDCYNVQHDCGIGQKPVEDTINDDRRIEVFNFEARRKVFRK